MANAKHTIPVRIKKRVIIGISHLNCQGIDYQPPVPVSVTGALSVIVSVAVRVSVAVLLVVSLMGAVSEVVSVTVTVPVSVSGALSVMASVVVTALPSLMGAVSLVVAVVVIVSLAAPDCAPPASVVEASTVCAAGGSRGTVL